MAQPPSIGGADYQVGDDIKGRWQIRNICGGKGRSGMGVVYIVDDLVYGRTLAAKTFQPHLVTNARVRQALEQEANAWLAMGTHPNIVVLNFVEMLGTQLYLFMDYVPPDPGGRNSLTHYLDESPLPEAQTAKWAIGMCRALSHMRASGIHVHRDIKPDNVMIDQAQTVRVTDFGLAKAYTGMTGSLHGLAADEIPAATVMGAVVGTPGYIAPEIVQGEPATVQSDIYAFGLVLVQMLTGKPWAPFTGTWQGDLMAYETGNLQIREALSHPAPGSPFEGVAAACLEYDPRSRFISFEEIERELETLCRRLSIEVPRAAATATSVSRPANAGIDRINALYNLGRLGEALDLTLTLLKADPDDPALLTCEGTIRADLGDTINAIPSLERACRLNPGWCGNWNNLGKSLRQAGQPDRALEAFETALQLDERYSNMWASKGNCLSDLGRFEEALSAYDRAIALDVFDWAAQLGRAKALAQLDRPVDAVGALEKVLDVEPDDAEARSLYDALVANIAAADPTTLHDAIVRSNDLYRARKFEEGLRVVRRARLQLEPTAALWNNEGVFLIELGDLRAALRCFERALRDNPEQSNLWSNKGRAYRRLNQPHEALLCHERAVLIDPGDVVLWTNKYACLLDLDLRVQARECFRSACEHAFSAEAKAHCRHREPDLYYLSMAEIAQLESRWADAHRFASSVPLSSPWHADARQILARAQFHLATARFTEDLEQGGEAFVPVIETLVRARNNIDDQDETVAVQQQIENVCIEYLNRYYAGFVERRDRDRACALLARVIDHSADEDLAHWATQQLDAWLTEGSEHNPARTPDVAPASDIEPLLSQAELDREEDLRAGFLVEEELDAPAFSAFVEDFARLKASEHFALAQQNERCVGLWIGWRQHSSGVWEAVLPLSSATLLYMVESLTEEHAAQFDAGVYDTIVRRDYRVSAETLDGRPGSLVLFGAAEHPHATLQSTAGQD